MANRNNALLEGIVNVEEVLLHGFTDERLVLGLVAVSVLFALLRIRTLAVPFIKLVVVYSATFSLALIALYGHEDLLNLTSLKHLRRTANAATIASALCFFGGFATPKEGEAVQVNKAVYSTLARQVRLEPNFETTGLILSYCTLLKRTNEECIFEVVRMIAWCP